MQLTREDMDAIEDAFYIGARHGIGEGYEKERAALLEKMKNSRAAKRYEERLESFAVMHGGKASR